MKDSKLINSVKNKPEFDFTYLENDIILATIDGESVDEIVKNALTKYRK